MVIRSGGPTGSSDFELFARARKVAILSYVLAVVFAAVAATELLQGTAIEAIFFAALAVAAVVGGRKVYSSAMRYAAQVKCSACGFPLDQGWAVCPRCGQHR